MSPEHNPNKSTQPSPSELTKSIYVRRSNGEVSTMWTLDNPIVDKSGRVPAYIIERKDEDGSEFIAGSKPISEKNLSVEMQTALGIEYGDILPDQGEKLVDTTKATEALGKEALEASNVEVYGEADTGRSYFKPGEIRIMRQAENNRMDERPALTSESVSQMMSGDVEIQDPLSSLSQKDQDDIIHHRRLQANKKESERDKDFSQAGQDRRSITELLNRMSPKAKRFLGL